MEKLQKHLDAQAREAVAQATERMLKNKTARDIVAERVAANPKALAEATDKMLNNKNAGDIVAKKMLKNKTSRRILGKRVAENPEALEIVAAEVSEEDWDRMVKAREAAKAKGRQEKAPDTA